MTFVNILNYDEMTWLTEKKNTHSCKDPIQEIVEGARECSWCDEYHDWNVPNDVSCPNVHSRARKAPRTVSHASHPPSGNSSSWLATEGDCVAWSLSETWETMLSGLMVGKLGTESWSHFSMSMEGMFEMGAPSMLTKEGRIWGVRN